MSDPAASAGLSLARRRLLAVPGLQRSLMGRRPVSPLDELVSIVAELDRAEDGTDPTWDRYGEGGPVAALESQVAALLGKDASVMFPSGTMAQQSALRVWSDRLGSRHIVIPGLSHLLHHEQDGPRVLNDFEWALLTPGVGTGDVVPTADQLAAIPGELGAALLELPLCDGGYLLPSWDQLEAFSLACSERGVPLHLDGARIWESGPFLGHTPVEIPALADTVYVSFYKGLRGLAGAVVAGPEEVISEVRLWRSRHGGTLARWHVGRLAGWQVGTLARWHVVDDVAVRRVRPARASRRATPDGRVSPASARDGGTAGCQGDPNVSRDPAL